MENKIKNRIVLGLLVSIFSIYNVSLYSSSTSASSVKLLSARAIKGEKVWQDNNCIACHQLYGLGGYLGPDLTNVISNPKKGKDYVKAFLNSGVKSMPKFNFSEIEKELLTSFLTEVDQTGFYPNKEAQFEKSGWVTIKYK